MLNTGTDVRYIAAGSPYTPPIVLSRLAKDASDVVRSRVAENPHTPMSLLLELIDDPNPDVRIALSDNPVFPEEGLVALLQDPCPDVRYAIAENARRGESILRLLADDDNPYVAARAALWRAASAVEKPAIFLNSPVKVSQSTACFAASRAGWRPSTGTLPTRSGC